MSKIVFLYNPRLPDAEPFADNLIEKLSHTGAEMVAASVWEEAAIKDVAPGSDFVVTLGGDGTVLRALRTLVPLGVPVVGINLGKLGFLTELSRQEAARKIPQFLRGRCWMEERIVLTVEVHRQPDSSFGKQPAGCDSCVETQLAINEIVVGRAALARAVDIHISVDGVLLDSYIADGAIVSTPTGSTAYSLAAGGPIIYPTLENLLITPILPHLSRVHPFVCPAGARVELEVYTSHQAGLTVDGQVEIPLRDGDVVRAVTGGRKAKFLRAQSPTYFYHSLSKRLQRHAGMDPHRRDTLTTSVGAS